VRGQICPRVMVDMRRPIIHYQMDPPGTCPSSRYLSQCPQEMLVVICVKATSPHHSVKDIECNQQNNCAMSFVLEFTSRNLPCPHRLLRRTSPQSLNVWLLINTDDQFAALMEPQNPLITPQNFSRSPSKLFIYSGCLPVARTMWLQAGRSQNAANCRVMNRLNDGLFDDDLLQRATVPPSQVKTICCRVGAGDALYLNPFDGGKKLLAARCALHRIWLQLRAPGNAAINTKQPCGSSRSIVESQQRVRLDQEPTTHALDWQHAGSIVHPLRSQSGSVDHFRSVRIQMACVLSSYQHLFAEKSMQANLKNQFIKKLLLHSTSYNSLRF
jgi:hypothetical protein